MARRTTISIPEELYQRMEEWKEVINFSQVFRESVHEIISRKEALRSQLKGDMEMIEIVERLRSEKKENEPDIEELAREEAVLFIKGSHYNDIIEALEWDPSGTEFPKIEDFHEYIHNVRREGYPELGLNDDEIHYWPYNDNNEKFWEGWKKGLEEFWEQVKDKVEG